jgi:hypothetical protein
MKSHPYLVEEKLAPSWLQPWLPTFLNLQGDELFLDIIWTLAALKEVRMNVLAR